MMVWPTMDYVVPVLVHFLLALSLIMQNIWAFLKLFFGKELINMVRNCS